MPELKVTPRVDHVRVFTHVVDFDAFTPQMRFLIRPVDQAILVDLSLAVNSRCAAFTQGSSLEARYPIDARIALTFRAKGQTHQIDVTPWLLKRLRASLDELDQSTLGDQYKEGMEYSVNALGPDWGYQQPGDNRGQTKIRERLAVKPLSSQLVGIGESSNDTLGGILSLSNYLYSFIPVPFVSLLPLLKEQNVEITDVTDLFLSVTNNAGATAKKGGQVDLQIQATYHNELVDEFNELETKIKARLLAIHKVLASDGPVIGGIADLKDSIMRLLRQINDLEASVQDQRVQIDSLNTAEKRFLGSVADLGEIKIRLDSMDKRLAAAEKANQGRPQ